MGNLEDLIIDCDGQTDEYFTYHDFELGTRYVGDSCLGIGECGVGLVECFGDNDASCTTNPGGSADESVPEICDGLDNDCDLRIDEDFDDDTDLVGDCFDNCMDDFNPDQNDTDGDGIGDMCDNCIDIYNIDQMDSDNDGFGDACDVCAYVYDPYQGDSDNDGVGDLCDGCENAYGTDFVGGCLAFVLLQEDTLEMMDETAEFIEMEGDLGNKQSHISLFYQNNVLIGYIPEEARMNLLQHPNILDITYDPIDPSIVLPFGESAIQAARYWNELHSGSLDVELGRVDDERIDDYDEINDTGEESVGPRPYEWEKTSEYMIGKGIVEVIHVESNGSIDPNKENWTEDKINKTYDEISKGLMWWTNKNENASVSFLTKKSIGYTSYEPISRPRNNGNRSLWVQEIMTDRGYNAHSWYSDNIRDYVNHLRNSTNRDWAFVIFVVNSENDDDGKFEEGGFAFAGINGPYQFQTSKNNGKGIENMDAVTAHETCHDYGAKDEYACITSSCDPADGNTGCGTPCTHCNGSYGYLGVNNSNCECCAVNLETSIMRGSTSSGSPFKNNKISKSAQWQVGWRDLDSDGILDPVDTHPNSTLQIVPPNISVTADLYYKGKTADSQNVISDVFYRYETSGWYNANPIDGDFDETIEQFNFTITLSDGTHTISVKAENGVQNEELRPKNHTVMVDTVDPIASIEDVSTYWVTYDYINISCTDATSGCKDTYWYYFAPSGCQNDKSYYNQSTTNDRVLVDFSTDAFFCLWVEDNAGHTDYVSSSSRLKVDAKDPDMPEYNIDEFQWYNTRPSAMDIDFEDNMKIDDIFYSVSRGVNWTLISGDTDLSSYTTDWPITVSDWDYMDDGTNFIYFKITDYAGNDYETPTQVDAFGILKDATDPHAPEFNTKDNSWFNESPMFDIDFYDAMELNNIYYDIDQTGWVILALNVSERDYDLDWSISSWNSLLQGHHHLYFKVTDKAGNIYQTQNLTEAFRFNKDTTKPNSPVYNTESGTFFNETIPLLDIDFSDNYALDKVSHKLNIGGSYNNIASNISNSTFDHDWNIAQNVWLQADDGTHHIYFKVKDMAGNQYETATQQAAFEIKKDTVPPVADAGQDIIGFKNEQLRFNGSNSF
jgi:hypothetical protein